MIEFLYVGNNFMFEADVFAQIEEQYVILSKLDRTLLI